MASKIRTALLSTAVASGLLLSNAPAYAAPLVEGNAALESTVEAMPEERESVQTPAASAPAASAPAAPVADVVDEQLPAQTQQQVAPDVIPLEESTSIEENTANTDGSVTIAGDEPSTESAAQPDASGETAAESSNAEETTQGTETSPVQSSAGTEAPIVVTTGTEVSDDAAAPSVETAESSVETQDEIASSSEAEINAQLSFDEFLEGLEMPEGSENWTEKQWNDYLETPEGQDFTDAVLEGMLDTEEFGVIFDIVADFLEFEDPGYLDELKDYLLELFGGNEEWAMEAYNGMAAELRAEGYLVEDWVKGPILTPTPTEPTAPAKPKPETKPEIKPAGNVKPVVDKKPIVEAVVKPVVQAKQDQLAQTGTDGTLLMGGAGVLLVGGGMLALGLRRKTRKH